MKVRELMTREVKAVHRSGTLADAVRIMKEVDCGAVPVIESSEDKRICGVVTDRDCALQAFERGERLTDIPVERAMTTDPVTCKADDSLDAAEQLMADAQVRRLPVVDREGRLEGMLATADVARENAADSKRQAATGATLAGISQPQSQPRL